MKPKTLLFDIETTPLLSYTWGKYEQNVISVEQHSHLLSFSAKKLGEKSSITRGLNDYKLYKKDPASDKDLVEAIHCLFDWADIIVAHNGRAFDIKKVNARFAFYGFPPPEPYQIVDTKEMSKRNFAFTSNSLNDIADYLGIGRKLETGGFELWKGCMAGDKESWKLMKQYNSWDVELLEKIYLKMLPYSKVPNLGSILEGEVCPRCGSDEIRARGIAKTIASTYHRFQCNSCGGWGRSSKQVERIKVLRSI